MADEQQTEQQNDFPQAWRPDPGDSITGTVVSVTRSPDFGYGPYPIVTLRLPDGQESAVHAMHQILRTELARRRAKRDDELEITYLGKRAPKGGNGNPFHVYRVKGGDEPEFNWDAELPEEDRRGATPDVPIEPAPVPATVSPGPPVGAEYGEKPPF